VLPPYQLKVKPDDVTSYVVRPFILCKNPPWAIPAAIGSELVLPIAFVAVIITLNSLNIFAASILIPMDFPEIPLSRKLL